MSKETKDFIINLTLIIVCASIFILYMLHTHAENMAHIEKGQVEDFWGNWTLPKKIDKVPNTKP